MTAGVAQAAVAGMSAAVDALLCAPLEDMPAPALTRLMCDLEVQRNRLAGVDQRVIAALGSSGAVLDSGSTSLPDLVSGLTRCSRGEARARVGRSVDLGPRRAVSGEALEPIHPLSAAAVAAGEVSEAQCQVIVSALSRIGPDAEPGAFEVAERFLVQAARLEPPAALARSARWVLAQLDPSGLEPSERATQRSRHFSLGEAPDVDGGVIAKGRLTPETAAALRAVLNALSAPRPAEGCGERDERSAGQRQHDALLEMALRILRSGELPDSGGVPASVVIQLRAHDITPTDNPAGAPVTDDQPTGTGTAAPGAESVVIDTDQLTAAGVVIGGVRPRPGQLGAQLERYGLLGSEGPVTLNQLRPLLDSCELTTVVLTATGGILDYGRERRTPPPAMRRALAGRDGGCCFPGCDRPPAWTEAHHILAWIDWGPTCIDNLCLLCSHHHRIFQPAGWHVTMRDGIPWWTPPPWLDPHQTPIRNTTRHLPAIDFNQVDTVLRR